MSYKSSLVRSDTSYDNSDDYVPTDVCIVLLVVNMCRPCTFEEVITNGVVQLEITLEIVYFLFGQYDQLEIGS